MSVERLGDLSRRRLLGHVASLAAPVVIANLSQTLMGLIDTLMVSRLGTAAIAAVGVATLLFSALAMALKSLDVAVQTYCARRAGAGRPAEVGPVLGTGLVIVLLAGTAVLVPGLLWPELGLSLISRDGAVIQLGGQYYALRLAGLLPFLAFFQIRACCDGLGRTRIGLVVGVVMNLINVTLNWGLIFGHLGLPALGVRGAALASSLASLAGAVLILLIVLRPSLRRRHRLFGRGSVRRELVWPLIRLGWPPAVQAFGLIGGIVVFYAILGQISTVAMAAGNIVMRTASLAIMPVIGVGVAVQTLVSQSLGARDARGAWRCGMAGVLVGSGLMAAVGLPFLLVPEVLLGAFAPDPAVLAAGRQILRLTALGQVLAAVGLTFAGVLRGAGDTRRVMLVDVATSAGFMLPAAWLLGVQLGGGLLGTWWALAAWFGLHAVIMTILFLDRRWLLIRL